MGGPSLEIVKLVLSTPLVHASLPAWYWGIYLWKNHHVFGYFLKWSVKPHSIPVFCMKNRAFCSSVSGRIFAKESLTWLRALWRWKGMYLRMSWCVSWLNYFVWLIPSWVCARLLYGTTEISIKDLLRASSTLKSALLTETAVLRDTAFFIKRHHCAGPIQEPKEQNKFVHSWSTILFRLVTPAIILPMIPPSCSKIGSCRWSTHCLLFFLRVFLLGWRYTTRTVFKNF